MWHNDLLYCTTVIKSTRANRYYLIAVYVFWNSYNSSSCWVDCGCITVIPLHLTSLIFDTDNLK